MGIGLSAQFFTVREREEMPNRIPIMTWQFFLNDALQIFDSWVELDRLAELRVKFLDETGAFFDAKAYRARAYGERSPLMHEVRREGIDF